MNKIKNNVISLDLIVLTMKIISLRHDAAVLLSCLSFSSWNPEEPCATSDNQETTDVQHER